MMIRNLVFSVLVGAGVMGSSTAIAGDADFTLVNRTGITINAVYLSPANKTSWGKDRLGEDTLVNTRSRLFKFSDKASCKQDLLVQFDDKTEDATWENINLCEVNKLTLKYNKATKKASYDAE